SYNLLAGKRCQKVLLIGCLPTGEAYESTELLAVAVGDFQSSRKTEPIVLVEGLSQATQKAAFARWQICLGHGAQKRILHTTDAYRQVRCDRGVALSKPAASAISSQEATGPNLIKIAET